MDSLQATRPSRKVFILAILAQTAVAAYFIHSAYSSGVMEGLKRCPPCKTKRKARPTSVERAWRNYKKNPSKETLNALGKAKIRELHYHLKKGKK